MFTQLPLTTTKATRIATNRITIARKLSTSIFQGVSLYVMLFLLVVNLLSALLKKMPKLHAWIRRKNKINVILNFFVDDLKSYSDSVNNIKRHLELVTTYS